MLHILTTLLATALLASSTGANAIKNYETHEEQNKTSLRARPKMAYYNPAETYGNTASTLYNYTESPLLGYVSHGTWDQQGQVAKNASCSVSIPSVGSPTITLVMPYNESTIGVIVFTSEAEQLDVYVDGVFAYTYSPFVNSIPDANSYQLSKTELTTATNTSYIWVFNHQEADPIEEMNENIFEAVGDTITGLSDALASPWEGILNIFYDTTENEVTQMGYLVLIGLGVSITLLVFWTILRLFKQRN